MTQFAGATHIRPKSASPIRVALVPAYKECTPASANRVHGPPLGFSSCDPPVPASKYISTGTPDVNGAPANMTGYIKLAVKVGAPGPPDDSDIQVSGVITDVRCLPGTDASVCTGNNAYDGPDYSGQLQGNATIRITDHFNGPSQNEPATVTDIPLPIVLNCENTSSNTVGGLCRVPPPSCLSCLPPKEGVRTVVEVARVEVFDGGPDGNPSTNPQDNTLFGVQGNFIP
jgi:hypothetical protein